MGLGIHAVETILKEHLNQPINQDVLLIGSQSIYFSPDEILKMLGSFNIASRLERDEIEIDKQTLNRRDNQKQLVRDKSLFQMLGSNTVKALDHSDYEGAEIIHDLTKPLPSSLHNIADFIVDGSTLDNVFNPVIALTNLTRMLRPTGRIILNNMYSNHHEPYNILPPLWYFDYFALNKFADCKVYIVVHMPNDVSNTFCINVDLIKNWEREKYVCNFTSPYIMGTLVFAEKGQNSTSDQYPIQQHYRSADQWSVYKQNMEEIINNPRPHVCRSHSPLAISDVKRGHLYMNNKFEAVDPGTEIKAKGVYSFKE